MSIDIVLRASTKAALLNWAKIHPAGDPLWQDYIVEPAVIDPETGDIITPAVTEKRARPGISYDWWQGYQNGKLMSEPRQSRGTETVDVVQGAQFGLTVGSVPPWADNTVVFKDVEEIGTFNRVQGNTVVYDIVGTAPSVGDSVDVFTLPKYAPGQVLILRIHSEFFNDDAINEGDGIEPHERSKVARYIKNNGTPGSQAGIPYYEFDGVRLMKLSDVNDWCRARGVPTHQYL